MYTITAYQPITDDDRPAALAILHEALGTDVTLPPNTPQHHTIICRQRDFDGTGWETVNVPCVRDEIIGVASAAILDNGDGQLLNSAVHRDFRKQGIGTELVARRLNWLRDLGVRHVTSDAWASRHGVNAARSLVKNGFRLVKIEPLKFSFCKDCPACRPGGCDCGAWVYEALL